MLLACGLGSFAQQRDPGAPQAVTTGTGDISGVVLTADANPQPVRRAVVTLTGTVARARSVLTDDAGRFVFSALPVGTFNVTARKAAYLAAPFGATRPGRTGTSIALVAGQRETITISMFRGATITGVLRDGAGLPVGGVDVRVIDKRTLLAPLESGPPSLATTDDRGVYRIYGLLPAEYVVVALPGIGGSGEIGAPSTAEVDAKLSAISTRSAAASSVTPVTSPTPTRSSRPIGFAPIFYPGTAYYPEAATVRIAPGEERSGIDFELKPVAVASIEGIVSGAVPDLKAVQLTIIPSGPRVVMGYSSSSLSGRPIDADGRFSYGNLPPGRYRLVARARRGDIDTSSSLPMIVNGQAVTGRGGGAPPADAARPTPTGDYLYGVADVDVRGEDVVGVSLPLQLGGVISGRIVFNGIAATPKPEDLSKVRAALSAEAGGWTVSTGGISMGTSLASQSISSVKPDGTFEIRGIGPGRFTLTSTVPVDASKAWRLRSAIAADRDLLDDAIEMMPGMEIRNVTIGFSDARTEISGSLQTSAGLPAADYHVVVFSTDRTQWRAGSRRLKSGRPATDGRFVFSEIPAGEYFLAALTDLDPVDWQDAAFLEEVASAAIRITVAEGEQKVQNLRIR